ncbi:MAG: hypothetical protein Fur0032_02230 [Terrimicrobiaceae bacterium]
MKFGTGVLARPGGGALDARQIRRIAEEIASLHAGGAQCIVVSSAAIAAGVAVLGMKSRPEDLPGKQACAAVGQPELMRHYTGAFRKYGLHVAQLLLTHGDLDSRTRHANARNTLERLLASRSIIPIINENDSVATEEVRFGDNDRLSAEVAVLIQATRLLVLTSSDGLTDREGRRIRQVKNLDEAFAVVRPEKGEFSVGGMKTKLEAVGIALAAGIPATILDGRKPDQIRLGAVGGDAGTRFAPQR